LNILHGRYQSSRRNVAAQSSLSGSKKTAVDL
jgi:hypothetical protein